MWQAFQGVNTPEFPFYIEHLFSFELISDSF